MPEDDNIHNYHFENHKAYVTSLLLYETVYSTNLNPHYPLQSNVPVMQYSQQIFHTSYQHCKSASFWGLDGICYSLMKAIKYLTLDFNLGNK
jgi:hypothetical protein